MAAHSSILVYRIPWIEEPGGLHSMGSQRVRHECDSTSIETWTRPLGWEDPLEKGMATHSSILV